jgi:hypothetical protein
MQRVSFLSRGVLILAVVLALNAPTYARGRREEPPAPKTPIFAKLLKFALKCCGDGIVVPWP